MFSNLVSLPSPHKATTMAEIKIDKSLFQERLTHFISAWKADKRSGDALFGGASSILILMGKTEETAQFQKNNAMHVCKPSYLP
jgi:nucleosome binding factor SPN SPT16 subunit